MDLFVASPVHEQRVYVVFTEPLGGGAFGVSPTAYVIENLDGRSPSPTIRAALIKPGDPNAVELALSTPMARGARFRLTVTAVPAAGAGTASGSSDFTYAVPALRSNLEPAVRDVEVLLYGSDLAWNGDDFQETATGDFDSTDGTATVSKALDRRCRSGPLAWDNSYGARSRDYVDSPTGAAGTLRGSLAKQCSRDPRVAKVEVRAVVETDTTSFDITPKLITGAAVAPVNVKVPNG